MAVVPVVAAHAAAPGVTGMMPPLPGRAGYTPLPGANGTDPRGPVGQVVGVRAVVVADHPGELGERGGIGRLRRRRLRGSLPLPITALLLSLRARGWRPLRRLLVGIRLLALS